MAVTTAISRTGTDSADEPSQPANAERADDATTTTTE